MPNQRTDVLAVAVEDASTAEPVPCCAPLVREPISGDWAGDLALVFKALGDPVRLRLLSLVASSLGGEACVCDLTARFSLSQPTISHHLKVLRGAGLLECERRGTWVWYRVVPSRLAQLAGVLGPAEADPVPDDAAGGAAPAPGVPA